jgi:hypothetical protein
MSDRPDGRQGRLALALLALMTALFVGYIWQFVPHLTNNFFGDVEFTGWSGPIGARIAAGERPYVDFVLPIPPGSFVLLAAAARVAGRSLLLHELWLNALIHLSMGLVAYSIAVRLTTRTNAVLVALCTLVTVVGFNKECAYDHTAQIVAWLGVTVGLGALLAPRGARRARWWAAAGLLSSFTIAFKQSTGVGAIVGWGAALSYLAVVELVSGHRERVRRLAGDLLWWGAGVAGGLVLVASMLWALGSTLPAFFQAVFVDGPHLKGGAPHLVTILASYLLASRAYPAAIGFGLLLVFAGSRILRAHGGLHIGDEPARRAPLGGRAALVIAAAMLITFGLAIGLLVDPGGRLDPAWVHWADRFRQVPAFGLVFGGAFLVAHLRRVPADDAEPSDDAPRVGHIINALVIVALAVSLLHNTSAPEFRAFYDNNPIIPVAFLFLFVGLDRAGLAPVKGLVVVLALCSLFGNKLGRALDARTPVGDRGFWAGMQVSPRGAVALRAVRRIRQLAGPDETVLVLPEDVDFAAAIGRPRPKLRGAIVFVDQYPERLAARDIRWLRAHPPKVIVIHPNHPTQWAQLFRIWSGDSGAEHVLRFVLRDLLPRDYRRDSTYPTQFLWHRATLEVWVRKSK